MHNITHNNQEYLINLQRNKNKIC